MKRNKIMLVSILLLIIIGSAPGQALTKQREIYIGDIIKLELSQTSLSQNELKQKFSDFELVSSKPTEDGYQVAIRSFSPGKKVIRFGNKNLEIIVKSTLGQYDSQDILPGDLDIKEAGFNFSFSYILYLAVFLIVIVVCYYLWKTFMKKKSKELAPYQQFKANIENVEFDNTYFVKLTYSLKIYIERQFNCQIIGKTSTEIVAKLKEISALEDQLDKIEKWLKEVEIYKYTTAQASKEEQEELTAKLEEIVEQIELQIKDSEFKAKE